MQRCADGQEVDGLCVKFGEKTFHVMVSEEEGCVGLKFGNLSLLGGAYYISETSEPWEVKMSSGWCLGQPIMAAKINGEDVTVQV